MISATRRRWSRDGEYKLYRFPRRGMHRVQLQLDRRRFFGLVGVEPHTTYYKDGSGCFPLCEGCWSSLTPEQRFPYYQALVQRWCWQDPERTPEYLEDRDRILAAVLAGA